ncbi:OmpA family protein [Vaginella massiliensis]|uniref:OmpA family protein n=1 Tax=Vaginella massiliensis TaxID=1816680 RepID=UPI00083995F0|nr:OmpA family protein [Vaginella massiliensis]
MIRFLFWYFLVFVVPLQAQSYGVFPYLEVENEAQFASVKVQEFRVISNIQTVLASVESFQNFANVGQQPIAVKYVIPHQPEQNIYQLVIKKNDETIELSSKSIFELRKEAQRKNQSLKTNQEASLRMEVELSDLQPNESISVEIKWTKSVQQNLHQYAFELNVPIAKRTKNFTQTKRFPYNLASFSPEKFSIELNFFGENLKNVKGLTNDFEKKPKSATHTQYISTKYWASPINVRYEYVDEQMNAELLQYQDENCRYVLGNIQPPAKIDTKNLKPREYIFLLDASGSMKGKSLEHIRQMMMEVIEQLSEQEKFNIFYFNKNTNQLSPRAVFATPEQKQRAVEMLRKMESAGSLKLTDALKRVNNIPVDYNFNRLVVIASDGRIDPNQNIHLDIQSNLKNAHYFILGIGQQVDYKTMNYLGYTTGIQPLIIDNEKDVEPQVKSFQQLILTPILRNIEVKSTTFNLNETFPRNFNGFLSNRPINFVTRDCKKTPSQSLVITGKDGDFTYKKEFQLKQQTTIFAEAIKYYWVQKKIQYLMMEEERCGDYCKKTGRYRKEIEQLGERYNIATPYNLLVENRSDLSNNQFVTFHYDYDSDGDGVHDLLDKCPTQFGLKEANGCPIDVLSVDSKKNAIENLSNSVLKSLKFDFDSDEIRKEDFIILDEILKLMLQYPTYTFTIVGHTDASGTAEYNQNLSFRRANAVRIYLEKHGIDSKRLTSKGVGAKDLLHKECRPVEVCPEWKNFENRRVQIIIE